MKNAEVFLAVNSLLGHNLLDTRTMALVIHVIVPTELFAVHHFLLFLRIVVLFKMILPLY